MKVLIVGNGAREHVMGETLARNSDVYAAMNARNPGLISVSKKHAVGNIMDPEFVLKSAKKWEVNMCVVGPEAPLGEGATDLLEENSIPCASPSRAAAQIELDKKFCRELMQKYDCRGKVMYKAFSDAGDAAEFIDAYGKQVVIKPIGLTGGKGVKIVADLPGQLKDLDAAKKYAKEVIEKGVGGSNEVVIEERLIGEEFTLQGFVDGECVAPMPAVQDHKFAYDGDKGPFTGGMGSYSAAGELLPFMEKRDYEAAVEVMGDIVCALQTEGTPYKGVMYGQFMLTADGPKVVEVNARFGDPEAMNVLPLLKTSYVEICEAMNEGELANMVIEFEPKATVCKYIVPKGYPEKPEKGKKISLESKPKGNLYYASVDQKNSDLYMSSSRAMAFVGIGGGIDEAEKIASEDIKKVKGSVHYRNDIGTKELVQKRVEHMQEIRSKKP